jgi:thiol-disulfide isomerase/thioredoxin
MACGVRDPVSRICRFARGQAFGGSQITFGLERTQAVNYMLGNNHRHVMKAILLLVLCMSALSATAFAKTPGEVDVGGVLRDAPLYGFAGDYRKLSELRGKPLIINVWASWCGPCRAEMGSLERLSRRFGGKQFNIIGVSTDDDARAAAAFLRQAQVSFDNYLDRNLLLEHMLGADTIPLTILVDARGRVLSKFHGSRQWDSPEALELIGKAFRKKL